MNAHQATRTTAIAPRQHILCVALMIGTLLSATHAFGQQIRFLPIRSAPLGSPSGTVGEPVTPEFNPDLGCWELVVPGGVEVDLDLQGFGWGDAPGSPTLGAIQATVVSAYYDNGFGEPLLPKGWPQTPGDGAYQARNVCSGNGDPCNAPFDGTCDGFANGFCIGNPAWIMPPCTNDLPPFCCPTLDYGWAVAAQVDCNVDDGEVKTFGGLILNVPVNAAGTYRIVLDRDPNNTFMTSGAGTPIPGLTLTDACITIGTGACCADTNVDGQPDTCHIDSMQVDCVAAGGLFLGDGSACSGGWVVLGRRQCVQRRHRCLLHG